MQRDEINKRAIELHKKHKGKFEIKSKVSLESNEDLSLAYTPGVAEICSQIAEDKEKAREFTIKNNSVAVITDGSSVLGLGNLGALAALPVMEGKAILLKDFAGIDAFPICLDTQDTEEIIKTVKNIAPAFGGIQLEDIAAPKCFEIERRLMEELDIPVIHDDQRGTATVVLAAVINSLKLSGLIKESVNVVVNGAGAAGISITRFLLNYGIKNIKVCDTKGAIYKGRGDLNNIKSEIAGLTNVGGKKESLGDVLTGADIFIGVSRGGIVSESMLRVMNDKPIILALANPIPEIMPDLAKKAGAYIVATGRSDFPNQVNNLLAFPGIFRGALDNKVSNITDKMLIRAAEALAGGVSNLKTDKLLPDVFNKDIVFLVASEIKEFVPQTCSSM